MPTFDTESIKSFYLRRDILRVVQTRKNIRSLSLWIIFERYFTQETFSLADISFIVIASIYEIKKDSD